MSSDTAPIPIDDLLADAAWTRSLAGSLVADEATADDLVQETHAAALDRPPAEGTPQRAWLRTVLRNFARKSWRSEGRRRERERAAARPEADGGPGPAELASRLETQRKLARIVAGLPEPYRSTVILRYWEGLNSTEIAKREGVSAGTVRWRLSKAMAELRSRLDEEHEGDRKAWVALLLPIAIRPPKKAAVAVGLTGVFLFSKLTSVAAVVVVAALVLHFSGAWEADAPVRPNVLEEEAPQTRSDAAPEAPVEGTADPVATTAARPEEKEKKKVSLRLRVLDQEGQPVKGALARRWPDDTRFETDGNGFATVEAALEADRKSVSIEVRAEGYAQKFFGVPLPPGGFGDPLIVTLEPGGDVIGRVVDPEGEPVAGASVRLEKPSSHFLSSDGGGSALTQKDGTFRIEAAPVGFWRVTTRGDRTQRAESEIIEIRAGEAPPEVTLTVKPLSPRQKFEGVVLDPNGKPVRFARIRYEIRTGESVSGSGTHTADHEGRFFLKNSRYGSRANFAARDPDDEWREARVDGYVPGSGEIVFRLTLGRRMKVAVPEIVTKIVVIDDASGREHRWVYPKDGVVEFMPPAVPFRLRVDAKGHEPKDLGPWEPNRTPTSVAVELTPRPGIRGTTVPGAKVVIVGFLPPDLTVKKNSFPVNRDPDPKAEGVAGPDGRFLLHPESDAAKLFVRVIADGYAPAESEPFDFDPEEGVEGIDATPGPGGAIEGRVTIAGGGDPAGRIIGLNRGDGYGFTVRVGKDGGYRVENLIPGPWHLAEHRHEVLPDSYFVSRDHGRPEPIPFNCEVREGKTTTFDLTLEGDTSVLLGKLTIDGKPPKAWRAGIYPVTGSLFALVETDVKADGTFRLKALGGRRRLLVHGPGQSMSRPFALVDLDLRGETRIEIEWRTGELHTTRTERPDWISAWHRADLGDGIQVFTPLNSYPGEFRVPAGAGVLVKDTVENWLRPMKWTLLREVSVPEGGVAKIPMPTK